MPERKIKFNGRNYEFNGRVFESQDECFEYMQSIEDEGKCIRAAMQRCPLREGDKIERRVEVIDEEEFFVSKVVRADCRIEVWMKRYEDSDYTRKSMTHEGYSFVAGFSLDKPEPLLPMTFDDPIFS